MEENICYYLYVLKQRIKAQGIDEQVRVPFMIFVWKMVNDNVC